MRRIRYVVAASLDGYIAGPQGEADWIIMDPTIDFAALFRQFDTVLVGRRTFESMLQSGNGRIPGMQTIVFSRTMQGNHPGITMLSERIEESVARLRQQPGKDIWLMGGGTLFRSLAGAKLVDTVEVAVIPILLGAGIPLLPSPSNRIPLRLQSHTIHKSGVASLVYTTALSCNSEARHA